MNDFPFICATSGPGESKGHSPASLFPFTENSRSFCLWRVARRAKALLMPFSMDAPFAVSILSAHSAPYNKSFLIEMGAPYIHLRMCSPQQAACVLPTAALHGLSLCFTPLLEMYVETRNLCSSPWRCHGSRPPKANALTLFLRHEVGQDEPFSSTRSGHLVVRLP